MRLPRSAAALLLAGAVSTPVLADCKGLKIDNAWIPEAPPVTQVLAGFAKLSNDSDRPLHIDAVDGADFGSVEMHEMSMARGMMQMRPLAGLDVPAHGSTLLADGGKHLMLMDPKHPFKADDSTLLGFHCGKEVTQAQFTVRVQP